MQAVLKRLAKSEHSEIVLAGVHNFPVSIKTDKDHIIIFVDNDGHISIDVMEGNLEVYYKKSK